MTSAKGDTTSGKRAGTNSGAPGQQERIVESGERQASSKLLHVYVYPYAVSESINFSQQSVRLHLGRLRP